MTLSDKLEFWLDGHLYEFIESHAQPLVGDLISIRAETYTVIGRNFCLDHADDFRARSMRLAVILERFNEGEE